MITGTHGSIGPFCDAEQARAQPFWNTATVAPSAPPMLSRFITAAWSGITSDRKITNSSNADSTTTIAMNSGSFCASTCEKSIEPAVKPPTKAVIPSLDCSGGSTSLRRWLTSLVVAAACGADDG